MKTKTKKAISFAFHMTIFAVIIASFIYGNKKIAFYCMAFIAFINYAAAITNNEFYLEMKNLASDYSKTTDNLIQSLNKLKETIKKKDKSFEEIRTLYVLSKSENLAIKDMNDRLNSINTKLRGGI